MMYLGGKIERPRRPYKARVLPTVPACAEYSHEEAVRTLADGDRMVPGGAR